MGAAGGIRHTNALYKRNEQLLDAAGVWTGIGQPSAANVHWGESAIANPKTDFNHIANTFTATGVFGQYLHINHKIIKSQWYGALETLPNTIQWILRPCVSLKQSQIF